MSTINTKLIISTYDNYVCDLSSILPVGIKRSNPSIKSSIKLYKV